MAEPKDLLDKDSNPYELNGANVKPFVEVLTDDDLISPDPVQWSGMGFRCKKCGNFAILDFMKRCGECGFPVPPIESEAVKKYRNGQ